MRILDPIQHERLLNKLSSLDAGSLEEIDALLCAIQAPESLKCLFGVLKNLAAVLLLARAILPAEHHQTVAELARTNDRLLALGPALERDFPLLFPVRGKDPGDNFQSIKERYPLYAALGHLPVSDKPQARYLLLLSQIFSCVIASGIRPDPDSESVLLAFRAIRHLAKPRHQAVLASLPASPAPPDGYLESLNALDCRELRPIINWIADKLAIQRRREARGDARKSASGRFDGQVRPGSRDGEESEGSLVLRSVQSLQDEEEDCRHGGARLEDTARSAYFIYERSTLHRRARGKIRQGHNAARRVIKQYALSNQLFRFDWSEPSLNEIAFFLGAVRDARLAPSLPANLQDAVRACLLVSFWTGNSVSRAARFHYSRREPIDGDFNGLLHLDGAYFWHLHSPGPKLVAGIDRNSGKACPVVRAIRLPVPGSAVTTLDNHLRTVPSHHNIIRLFPFSPEEAEQLCAKYLVEVRQRRFQRLNPARLRSYLPAELARHSQGETAVANLVLGRKSSDLEPINHYTAVGEKRLQTIYMGVCDRLESRIFGEGPRQATQLTFHDDRYLGTPLRPTTRAVRELAGTLRRRIAACPAGMRGFQLIKFHNLYVLYTSLLLNFATGIRAVDNPTIPASRLDLDRGLGVLADKKQAENHGCRLIWLAPACRQQIRSYLGHLDVIYDRLAPGSADLLRLFRSTRFPERTTDLFFLGENGEPVVITRGRLEKILSGEYGYDLPANAHRHYLRSSLLEYGCPVEVINAFLGHGMTGQEPWTRFSALSQADYQTALSRYLAPLLEADGWLAMPGLAGNCR